MMEQQVDKSHYVFGKYGNKARFASYYHQIDEVLKTKPTSVLEVGVGDKVFANFLMNNTQVSYKSLDIAADLHPDIVGSVESIPLPDNSVDTAAAFEILEHLPFEKFEACVLELRRVSKKNVVLSLPHYGPPIKFLIKLPCFPEIQFAWKFPHHPIHTFNGEHYWEIGKKGYNLRKIKDLLEKYFIIEKDFIPFENQYHHFFVLSCKPKY
ncbi:MAG TPA: class I SAM-dependent methyltransferase [Patescibacteria group bacterium]|nr:class I SAM-dependent methyltransferase [Patescibacteria group bacterium]